MKIVIDISEELYQMCRSCLGDADCIESVIANGTPLPKGHGRLIDANVLCDYFWDNRSKLYTHKDLRIVIDRADTIIEADKEGENEVSN